MTTTREEETNRMVMLLYATKAGLTVKDERNVVRILSKKRYPKTDYSKLRISAHAPDILRYGDGCLSNGTVPWTKQLAEYREDEAPVPAHIHRAMLKAAAKKVPEE